MQPVTVNEGVAPVVLAMPHSGVFVPEQVATRLTPAGQNLVDTDWHIDQLYDGLLPGATVVRANFHRYVIDANRSPEDESLYPGQNTTGLVPETTFDGEPLWTSPTSQEERSWALQSFHAPYHAALSEQLMRTRERHGIALLYDCHSIRCQIPYLFEGTLPDLNIGTYNGTTCDPRIETAVSELCERFPGRTSVVNGRFKGGWTTRHYGKPEDGVHAIQMELSQSLYLHDTPRSFSYSQEKAKSLRPQLQEILESLESLVLTLRKPL